MAPIDDPNDSVGRLACELREGRSRRGLTRWELAAEINRSVTTIQRAEAGEVRPTLMVARDMAAACDTDLNEIENLWKKAGLPGRGHRLTDAPRLKLVRTSADLAAALRRVWEENGEPSSRQMEERAEDRAKDYGTLSRMSAWRIRERKQPVTSVHQMHAYLIACQEPESSFVAWASAWHRAKRAERSLPKQAPAPASRHPRRRVTPARPWPSCCSRASSPSTPTPGTTRRGQPSAQPAGPSAGSATPR